MLDTSVIVSAFKATRADSASRAVLARCLSGEDECLLGPALWSEWRDVSGRAELFSGSDADDQERATVLDALASVAEWTTVHFRWRPNLRDEADNHLIELALAGHADAIVTFNLRDLTTGELRWPELKCLAPAAYLEHCRVKPVH